MKHTPEPWTFYPPIMEDKNGTIMGGHPRCESIIATIHHPIGEDETLEDNAALINAAPIMFAALKQISTIMMGSKAQMENQIRFARTTANQAIRKVEETNA